MNLSCDIKNAGGLGVLATTMIYSSAIAATRPQHMLLAGNSSGELTSNAGKDLYIAAAPEPSPFFTAGLLLMKKLCVSHMMHEATRV